MGKKNEEINVETGQKIVEKGRKKCETDRKRWKWAE